MTGPELFTTDAVEATEAVAASLADRLSVGDLVLLGGDLAAGKTTFVRGLVEALGGDPHEVSSPTFVLVQSYPCPCGRIRTLHHVDLYRLSDRVDDLREVGLEDLVSDPAAVVAVEWPRHAFAAWLPDDARIWRVDIDTGDDGTRSIAIRAE